MAPARHPLRSYVVGLFRSGELVNVREAVQICGATRQAITRWLKHEGINVQAHRLCRIATLATNAQRYLDGLPPLRRPTKRQMRQELEQAMKRFNEARGKHSQISH